MERSKTMIGTRLKQARIAAGLSPCDLADQCDLSAVTICRYEDDIMKPSSDVLATLARLLGVRVGYFSRQQKVKLAEVSSRKSFDLSDQEKSEASPLRRFSSSAGWRSRNSC
jgi:transcriptional regulator with XRE-family HTH domain